MYIYELPYQINKELSRLLDHEEDWKELADNHMKYSAFEIDEIEANAHQRRISPTTSLFKHWGQQNHTVEELFILLYRMRHIPALRCLLPIVDNRYHRLLQKHEMEMRATILLDENANRRLDNVSRSSIPLPVMLIEKGVQLPSSSEGNQPTNSEQNDSPSIESTTGNSTKDSSVGPQPTDNQDEFLRSVAAIPYIRYEDLKAATDDWSNSNLLGQGGFGQVFKGEWKLLPIAVKRLVRDDDGKNKELIREMCPNRYRHDNILPLYGYSLGGPEACLVYQLMEGGSLEQRIRSRNQQPLSWTERYNIARGVARGLAYLHTLEGSPTIHGDIKPANILLDRCTMPKIGDFGLARKGAFDDKRGLMKVSKVHGTVPYLPEEYITTRCLSPAVDVFSYGVVIIELTTALPALDKSRIELAAELEKNRPINTIPKRVQFLYGYMQHFASRGGDFTILEDRRLKGTSHSNPHRCRQFLTIGLHCTKNSGSERPTMLEVYRKLEAMDMPKNY